MPPTLRLINLIQGLQLFAPPITQATSAFLLINLTFGLSSINSNYISTSIGPFGDVGQLVRA